MRLSHIFSVAPNYYIREWCSNFNAVSFHQVRKDLQALKGCLSLQDRLRHTLLASVRNLFV